MKKRCGIMEFGNNGRMGAVAVLSNIPVFQYSSITRLFI
jgi:hypothetical protein